MTSYELMNSINKEAFEKKISILLFSNKNKIVALIKIVNNYLDNIKKNLTNLAELKEIIEKYYYWKDEFYENISLIDKTANIIKKGLLNEYKKASIKDDLYKLNKIYDENAIHKKYIMQDSFLFKHENIIQGNKRLEIDKVFRKVSEKYNELAILFDKNWQSEIKNETIYNYNNIIKQTEEDKKSKNTSFEEKLKKDLKILSNYHNSNKNDSELNKLRDDIIIHIDCIDIQSFLNKKKSYYESRNSRSYNEFKIKLEKTIEDFKPKHN